MTSVMKNPLVVGSGAIALVGIGVYVYQLLFGLGITGMHNSTSWGLYLTCFMFFVGLSAGGQGAVTGKPELMLLPQKVSTGLTDIMMPVADEAELEKIAPDFPALTEHSRRYNVVGVHAFTVNTADGMIHARNFAPLYDIDEEAATGTSNGALVYYLYRHGLVELDKVYTVVQGEKMGRPSMISAQVILKDGQPFVKVGGPAVTLVRGEIEL